MSTVKDMLQPNRNSIFDRIENWVDQECIALYADAK